MKRARILRQSDDKLYPTAREPERQILEALHTTLPHERYLTMQSLSFLFMERKGQQQESEE